MERRGEERTLLSIANITTNAHSSGTRIRDIEENSSLGSSEKLHAAEYRHGNRVLDSNFPDHLSRFQNEG
jgi:hypothetical protein